MACILLIENLSSSRLFHGCQCAYMCIYVYDMYVICMYICTDACLIEQTCVYVQVSFIFVKATGFGKESPEEPD